MAILKTANTKNKYYDENSKDDVITYILNPEKTIHGYVGSKGFVTDNPVEEMKKTSEQFDKSKGVQLRHFIVSFTPHDVCNPKAAYQIGDEICTQLGSEYQTVFGVHENTDELHLHIVTNSVSFVDGHRYKGDRKDFYQTKDRINGVLKKHNIRPVKYVSNKK